MSEKDKATLNYLVGILQGNKELSEAAQILLPRTPAYLDNYHFEITLETWKVWLAFLNERGRVSNVSGNCTEIKQNADGTYTLVGEWTGEYQGQPVVSAPISATYRIRDGKIIEIRTTRTNYIFFFPIMRYRVGLWLVCLYALFWMSFLQKSTKPAPTYS